MTLSTADNLAEWILPCLIWEVGAETAVATSFGAASFVKQGYSSLQVTTVPRKYFCLSFLSCCYWWNTLTNATSGRRHLLQLTVPGAVHQDWEVKAAGDQSSYAHHAHSQRHQWMLPLKIPSPFLPSRIPAREWYHCSGWIFSSQLTQPRESPTVIPETNLPYSIKLTY